MNEFSSHSESPFNCRQSRSSGFQPPQIFFVCGWKPQLRDVTRRIQFTKNNLRAIECAARNPKPAESAVRILYAHSSHSTYRRCSKNTGNRSRKSSWNHRETVDSHEQDFETQGAEVTEKEEQEKSREGISLLQTIVDYSTGTTFKIRVLLFLCVLRASVFSVPPCFNLFS